MRRILPGCSPTLKDEVDAIIRHVDADNSGTIDFDEFLTLMSDPKFNHKDENREVFNMFDKDGNGYISAAELKTAFRNIGQLPQNFSPR